MTFLRTAVLSVGMMSLVACGGSSDSGSTTPVGNPCEAQPCEGGEENPCEANPCEGGEENPCEANPCEAGENPCEMGDDAANPCG